MSAPDIAQDLCQYLIWHSTREVMLPPPSASASAALPPTAPPAPASLWQHQTRSQYRASHSAYHHSGASRGKRGAIGLRVEQEEEKDGRRADTSPPPPSSPSSPAPPPPAAWQGITQHQDQTSHRDAWHSKWDAT
eukprot:2626201-Rhodomonas_salina.1